MIVFDLVCGDGNHVFEAWFGSTEDYESQQARGLVSCPMCGSSAVSKAVMAPRIGLKGNQRSDKQALPAPTPASMPASSAVPMASGEPSATAIKAMMQALAKAQAEALKTSDYVGTRFAEEARAIHLGETEERTIHGQATPEEAKALIEDGVPVAPLPFPVRPPGRDN
jgi:hypothetical protein